MPRNMLRRPELFPRSLTVRGRTIFHYRSLILRFLLYRDQYTISLSLCVHGNTSVYYIFRQVCVYEYTDKNVAIMDASEYNFVGGRQRDIKGSAREWTCYLITCVTLIIPKYRLYRTNTAILARFNEITLKNKSVRFNFAGIENWLADNDRILFLALLKLKNSRNYFH